MRSLAWAAAAAVVVVAAPLQAEPLSNATVGISVEKPDSWHVVTAEENADALARTEIGDKAMQEAIRKYAQIPLYAFTKFPEPYDDLNPTFKLNTRPAGVMVGKSGSEMLKLLLPMLQSSMTDFKVVTAPHEVQVDGRAAGHVLAHYTLKVDGAALPSASEIWIVPRGNHVVMIGTGYRIGDSAARAELSKIVQSVRIAGTR